jgi:hypothetical protein
MNLSAITLSDSWNRENLGGNSDAKISINNHNVGKSAEHPARRFA